MSTEPSMTYVEALGFAAPESNLTDIGDSLSTLHGRASFPKQSDRGYSLGFDNPMSIGDRAALARWSAGTASTTPLVASGFDAPTEAAYALEWHLGKLGGIEKVWADYTGTGVHVGVYDSGVQYSHPDLAANYDASLEIEIDGKHYDGDYRPLSGPHGTSVAGLIAAARNGIDTVGVAYDASITGVNIFDPYSGKLTDPGIYVNADNNDLFFEAVKASARFDVVNHSWGARANAFPDLNRAPGTFATRLTDAFAYAAEVGRDGLGTIQVKAAGNDGLDVEGDGQNTGRHQILVGAYRQVDGSASSYSNSGAALLISAPSNDYGVLGGTGVVTTDLLGRDGYNTAADPGGLQDITDGFGGTSAATPIVTGVVALMLDANADLGWRDVKDIIAHSASLPVPFSTGLTYASAILIPGSSYVSTFSLNESRFAYNGANDSNGGGLHYSNDYGYGAINALAAVRMSEVWGLFGAARTSANETVVTTPVIDINIELPFDPESIYDPANDLVGFNGTPTSFTFEVDQDLSIEHMELKIDFTRDNGYPVGDEFHLDLGIGGWKIRLTSPDGTQQFVDLFGGAGGFPLDDASQQNWTFGFAGFIGERSAGTWTVEIEDPLGLLSTESVKTVQATFTGSTITPDSVYHYTDEFSKAAKVPGESGRYLLTDEVGTDWIDAAAVSQNVLLDLNQGAKSRFGGLSAFTIAADTIIENAVTGDGNDRITGNDADNQLHGMRGNDTIIGGKGDDLLYGGTGDDTLEGGAGKDTLDGGDGFDTASFVGALAGVTVDLGITGAQTTGDGIETLIGIERLVGSRFRDHLTAAVAGSTLDGRNGNDIITGRSGDDHLIGGGGNDVIVGGAGDDRIDGGFDRDTLSGGDGEDILDGGSNSDTLTGGAGFDTFLFANTGSRDVITDFMSGIDKIDLHLIDAIFNNALFDPFTFIGDAAFTAAGQLHTYIDSGLLFLAGDINGDGTADLTIEFANAASFVASDLILGVVPSLEVPQTPAADVVTVPPPTIDPLPLVPPTSQVADPASTANRVSLGFDNPLDDAGRAALGRWGSAPTSAALSLTEASPSDPSYAIQWHLGKLGGIEKVWADYTGEGIHVGVYDAGIEASHPDLVANYDASRELTIDGVFYSGDYRPLSGPHGTSVAGLIAAARNDIGGVGVAYDANITGVNIFDPYSGGGTDPGIFVNNQDLTLFIKAIERGADFDIVNNSWGRLGTSYLPEVGLDEGTYPRLLVDAWTNISEVGRGGLGTIILNASGNFPDQIEGYAENTDRHVIVVGAYREIDGSSSYYETAGPALLVSAPSNDYEVLGGTGIVTTDLVGRDGYNTAADPGGLQNETDLFGGTSAATPIVSGVVALMLDADAGLGWRDVHNIIAFSASLPVPFETERTYYRLDDPVFGSYDLGLNDTQFAVNGADNANGGGLHYSNDYGYGAINAFNAVRMAEVWHLFGAAETSANEVIVNTPVITANLDVPSSQSFDNDYQDLLTDFTFAPAVFQFQVTDDISIEHIDFSITYDNIYDPAEYGEGYPPQTLDGWKIRLTSPDGTQSFIGTTVFRDLSSDIADNQQKWTFGLAGFVGDHSAGTWTVEVANNNSFLIGKLLTVQAQFTGSALSDDDTYHYTDEFLTMAAVEGEQSRRSLADTKGIDWIDAAAVTSAVTLSLTAGSTVRFGNVDAFTIAVGTQIENAVTGDGNDVITGNAVANSLYGMRGDDILRGGAGNDDLHGGTGNDVLHGGIGNDTLEGGLGSDWIDGGAGNDIFVGGGGTDTFLFDNGVSSGRDRIRDFGTDDVLLTTALLDDGNRDGIVAFGRNGVLDLFKGSNVAMFDGDGNAIRSLVYAGSYVDDDVTYYQYVALGGASTTSWSMNGEITV